jgi:hypothetical protein
MKVETEYTELSLVIAGVPQAVSWGQIYTCYTLQTCHPQQHLQPQHLIGDTAVLATDSDPGTASQILQTNLDAVQKWLKKWKIKANESESPCHSQHTKRNLPTSPYKQLTLS